MARTVLLENPYVTLWFHEDSRIVHHQMHRFVPERETQTLLMTGAQTMLDGGGCKWLSDDRKSPVVSPSRHRWAQEHWLPQMLKAGWKFWAVVQSEDALGQWSLERAAADYAAIGITASFFDDPVDALDWLEAQTP